MNPSVDSEEFIIIIVCLLPFAAVGIVTVLQWACGGSSEHIERRQTTKHKVDFELVEEICSQRKVRVALADARDWDRFDVSSFFDLCGEYSMAILGWHIFTEFATERKLTNTPAFSYETIINFFTAVQASYRGAEEVPFHNALHALDTMQKNYCMLRHPKFATFSYVEMTAAVCGMSCHDGDHDSTNNQFHRQTNSHLVQKYGGECPLEMHHAAVGMDLVTEHLVPHIAQCDQGIFLHVFNSVILGTDMAHHADHIKKLQSLPDDFSSRYLDERVILLSGTVHAADVSNPARSMDAAKPWIEKVYMEFAETGRKQRQRNLEVSMLCEEDPCINTGQVGFIKWILPLFQELGRLLPGETLERAIAHLEENEEKFEARVIEKELMASARRVPSSLFHVGSLLEAPDSFMDIGTCVSTPEEDSGSVQFDPENCLEFPTYSPPEKSPQFLGFPPLSIPTEIKIVVSNFSCSPDSSSAFHVPSAPSSPPPEPSPSYDTFLNSQFPDTPDDSSAFFDPIQLTPSASIISIEHETSIHI